MSDDAMIRVRRSERCPDCATETEHVVLLYMEEYETTHEPMRRATCQACDRTRIEFVSRR